MNAIAINNAVVKAERYISAGQLDAAWRIYEKLYAHAPGQVSVVSGLAKLEQKRGRYKRASKIYKAFLKKTFNPDIYLSLGECYESYGSYWLAMRIYKKLEILDADKNPINSAILHQGSLYLKLKKYNKASLCAERIIKSIDTEDTATDMQQLGGAYMLLADVAYEQEQLDTASINYLKARELFDGTLAANKDESQGILQKLKYKIALCFFRLDQQDTAIDCLLYPQIATDGQQRLDMVAENANYFLNHAMIRHAKYALSYLNRFDDNTEFLLGEAICRTLEDECEQAESLLAKVFLLTPDSIAAKYRLAQLRFRKQDLSAVTLVDECLKAEPENADYKLLGGYIAEWRYEFAKAEALLKNVLEQQPDNDEAAYPLAFINFTRGSWAEGFDYFSRRKIKRRNISELKRIVPTVKLWDGKEKLEKILVIDDQGIGDKLRYAVFYNSLSEYVKTVYLVTDIRLKSFFESNFPFVRVVPQQHLSASRTLVDESITHVTTPADLGCSLWQEVFTSPDLDKLPHAESGFLKSSVGTRRETQDTPFRIGVCWRGPVEMQGRDSWYMSLAQILQIFEGLPSAVELVLLQYNTSEEELKTFNNFQGAKVRAPEIDLRDDFQGMADEISQLDLVISPATALVELSGALGTPTWLFATKDRKKWNLDGQFMKTFYPKLDILFSEEHWGDVIVLMKEKLRRLLQLKELDG